MAGFRVSAEAERDLDQIVSYTLEAWGWRQTDQYLARLEDGFDLLARNSSLGRSFQALRAGMRRFEIGHHVVFYLPEAEGILVVRLLHERMMPSRYLGPWD